MKILISSAVIGVASAVIGVPGVVGVAQAQMYKCVQDGKTVYQQEKCSGTAKETAIRADPAPAAAAPAAADANNPANTEVDAKFELVADVLTAYNICAEDDPKFREENEGKLNEWGGRHAADYKAFLADPRSRNEVGRRMKIARERTSGEDLESRAKRAAICARVLGVIQQ